MEEFFYGNRKHADFFFAGKKVIRLEKLLSRQQMPLSTYYYVLRL